MHNGKGIRLTPSEKTQPSRGTWPSPCLVAVVVFSCVVFTHVSLHQVPAWISRSARCPSTSSCTPSRPAESGKSPSKVRLNVAQHNSSEKFLAQSPQTRLVSAFSHRRQRFEVADVGDVPTLRGGRHDRASPQRQETQVPDQVQEQQLVAQVQRELPLVCAAECLQIRFFNHRKM